MIRDLRLALRSLLKNPGFSAVVVVTLALGSGANAAIFSVFDQALLRALPVPAPKELVNLSSPGPKPGRTSTSGTFGREAVFSYPLFRDIEREQTVFAGLAAHRDFAANVAYRGQASSEAGLLGQGPALVRVPRAVRRLMSRQIRRHPGQCAP